MKLKNMRSRSFLSKVTSILLVLTVMITFIPILGSGNAYGENIGPNSEILLAKTVAKGKHVHVVSWTKRSDATGYDVYGARFGKPYQKIRSVNADKNKVRIKKRKLHGKYKYYVVAHRDVDGQDQVLSTSRHMISIAGDVGKGASKGYSKVY